MGGPTVDSVYDDVRTALAGALDRQAPPTLELVLLAGAVALALVLLPQLWPRTRHVVTIAHEGGHALIALLTGRRLAGIRLHSDTSGLTTSVGRPTGPGMVATLLVGYLTPPALGLVAAAALAAGWVSATLWVSLLLLAGMLLQIRNVFGGLLLLVAGAAVLAVSSWAPGQAQALAGCGLAWILLLGGFRATVELARTRRTARRGTSDADQLARLTRVPAVVWTGLFVIGGTALAVAGSRLLLPLG